MNDNHYYVENEKGSKNENNYYYDGKNDIDYHYDSKNVGINHFHFLGKCGKGYGMCWYRRMLVLVWWYLCKHKSCMT